MSRHSESINDLFSFIPAPLRNKYVLIAVLFFSWMLIFDRNDLRTQISLQNTLDKLETDKEFYETQIVEMNTARADLNKNIEKYAREKYFMSKKDEDVFIFDN